MIDLTAMQKRVAQYLSEGKSVEEIAAERHRSVCTIRKHIELARGRLQARSVPHLVAEAIRQGLIH